MCQEAILIFCGILFPVAFSTKINFQILYNRFNSSITPQDCGRKCAPHNEYGRPFCCDITQTIPTAFLAEWEYLRKHTNLWKVWYPHGAIYEEELQKDIPESQIPIQCLGHHHCQRQYRSITCRSFPFYPYFNTECDFIGFSYYWQYEDRCWLINNLHLVSKQYQDEFIAAHHEIFNVYPGEKDSFCYQSKIHRQIFESRKTDIPLFHEDGKTYLISTQNNQLNPAEFKSLPKHGIYKIVCEMPFPDEKENIK